MLFNIMKDVFYDQIFCIWVCRMEGDSLAPPCQSEDEVINSILDLISERYSSLTEGSPSLPADVHPVLYDLGCGDGRICVEACRRYAKLRAKGCEIEESLVARMHKNIAQYQLEDRMCALHDDLRSLCLDDAHFIVVYLLSESIAEVKAKLIHALLSNHGGRGCILVCNTWGIKDPDVVPKMRINCGYNENTTLFVYDRSSVRVSYRDTYSAPEAAPTAAPGSS
jgi:SAM-dependent methyltransferase